MNQKDDRSDSRSVLEVDSLSVDVTTGSGLRLRAVNGVSFEARRGETLALLGESGCGKSMTATALVDLLPPVAEVAAGSILIDGVESTTASPEERRQLAGPTISIVFQDALSALNPVFTVGSQIAEPFRIHHGLDRKESLRRAIELMDVVGIPRAEERASSYPHQFSGGMRQRLLIAMAIALDPKVLVADEPTTALDVTVQAQIMRLLKKLRDEVNMALVLITHDLSVVWEEAENVAVMYAGMIVEKGPVDEVFSRPRHPYTKGLLESVPNAAGGGSGTLHSIGGTPPPLAEIPPGCPYQDRCPLVTQLCVDVRPDLRPVPGTARRSACHFAEKV